MECLGPLAVALMVVGMRGTQLTPAERKDLVAFLRALQRTR